MRTSDRAPAIEAVVFDIGGVLIDWNPRHLFRKLFPHDEAGMERFLANVCTPEWNTEQDRGRPFAEGIAQLKARHPDRAPLIEAYRERWIEMLDGAIGGSVIGAGTGRIRRGRGVTAATGGTTGLAAAGALRFTAAGR